ncbi:MAG: sigma-70 family RNA polymerase sigma factor [Phycisphaerales bacterium]|nr:sigma-70 family RNA polymerase sigma factor [Phycisphaerales bacterium]
MDESHESLLARATAGDTDALVALLVSHGAVLRKLARKTIPPVHRAVISEDDLLQDVATQVFLGFPKARFEDPPRFFAWLQAVAENRMRDAIDYLNAAMRGGGRPAEGVSACERSRAFVIALLSSDGETPSLALREEEARVALELAIAQLPADQAIALRLYRLEGRPIEEVATALKRTPGAIHLLCDRAQRRLRLELAQDRSLFRVLA